MERGFNLFDRFGGIRPMAVALGESPSTVQSWKNTGRIPSIKQPALLEKAGERGIELTAEDVVFPLRLRPDIYPPEAGVPPCSAPSVAGGVPIVPYDRDVVSDKGAA